MKYPHALFLAASESEIQTIKERWDAFYKWAKDNLGQAYSLSIDEDGMIEDRTTRWAFAAFVAGTRHVNKNTSHDYGYWRD